MQLCNTVPVSTSSLRLNNLHIPLRILLLILVGSLRKIAVTLETFNRKFIPVKQTLATMRRVRFH